MEEDYYYQYKKYKALYKRLYGGMGTTYISQIKNRNYQQFFINAHGIVPLPRNISHKLGTKKVYYGTTHDHHLYDLDNIESYIGRVPDNTILIQVTPPDHFLLYDMFEKIPEYLMERLREIGLPFLFRDITPQDVYKKTYHPEDIYQSYMSQLIHHLQVYYPGDIFFNTEIVFETEPIDDIYNLDILENRLVPFNEVEIKLGKERTPLRISQLKMDSSRNRPKDQPYAYNYLPYSLQGLVDRIISNSQSQPPLKIIYCFVCNPARDKSLKDHSEIQSLRLSLYEKAKTKGNTLKRLLTHGIQTRAQREEELYGLESEFTGIPTASSLTSPFEEDVDKHLK